MKGGPPTNDLRMSLEPAATDCLNLLQFLKRVEDAIGKRLIGERPEAFSRLQLGRVGWQKEQMKPLRNHQIPTFVPAGLIKHQENVLVWPNLLFLCESGQREGEGSSVDGGHEQPTRLSALWLDKPIEMHPLIPLADHRSHSASLACPNAAQDGFEPDAMLILTPEFNGGVWMRLVQLFDLLGEFF